MLLFAKMKWIIKISCKYIIHWLKGKNKQGHGIHSPFVFDFVTKAIGSKIDDIKEIEDLRKSYKKSNKTIELEDYGAGSFRKKSNIKSEKNIVTYSTRKKINKLLYRVATYVKPDYIVELGTSFGFTTMYMAKAVHSPVFTIEGDPGIAAIAEKNIQKLRFTNVRLLNEQFESALPKLVGNWHGKGLFFIDGNHTYQATLDYFDYICKHLPGDGVLIFDDIYWSDGMIAAWKNIRESSIVPLTIDLFHVGIVFVKNKLFKQHYKVRF